MAKHSGATQGSVRLICGDHLQLVVQDDGAGFDPAAGSSGQLGLGIMRERAESIGADLRIESAPGRGTTVSVSWLTAAGLTLADPYRSKATGSRRTGRPAAQSDAGFPIICRNFFLVSVVAWLRTSHRVRGCMAERVEAQITRSDGDRILCPPSRQTRPPSPRGVMGAVLVPRPEDAAPDRGPAPRATPAPRPSRRRLDLPRALQKPLVLQHRVA